MQTQWKNYNAERKQTILWSITRKKVGKEFYLQVIAILTAKHYAVMNFFYSANVKL